MNEHGWNDPPVSTYSSLQTGGGKRTQLNKRVNHDLSATTHPPPSSQTPPTNMNPPPVTSTQGPPKLPNSDTLGQAPTEDTPLNTTAESASGTITLDSVLACIDRVIKDHKESISDRREQEIRNRLSVFSDQWKSGKLSEKVQQEMAKLAIALESGDFSRADEIHVALMVDHVSEVSRWMVGVKRLIAILKQ